jgi:hypothetical protein
VTKSLDQLVKGVVGTRATYGFDSDQGIIKLRDTAIDLLVGFADELIQQMVKSVFPNSSGLLLVMLARTRAVMAVVVMMVMMQMSFMLTLDSTTMHAFKTT